MIDKMNSVHVINFKSGTGVSVYNVYEEREELIYQWQMKREGEYDAWSKYLHLKNVPRFEYEQDQDDVEKDTSLSFEPSDGNLLLLPTKEVYFKNKMYFTLDRESNTWSYQAKDYFNLLELLPFNSEVLNRYAKHYKSDNRGKFTVFFFSIDPNYLTRTFSNILESEDLDFPFRFREGTVKTLVYPDSDLPIRIYSLYVIENLETKEIYRYNITTYFSENEEFEDNQEPAIPKQILEIR